MNTQSFPFNNTYTRLPERFFARIAPTPVAAPRLIRLNRSFALQLGLDPDRLDGPDGAQIFSGNYVPPNAEPIAMAYAGHQFGHFVPQLGDGRAILLGEVIDAANNRRDIHLKGAGRTPFSRGGDGRAALGPVLREYLVSEAMAALGIPTTRALAAATTGEKVIREEALPGAVFTRVASSHIRVGTFQFFASRGDVDGVRLLADHVIARHYPDAAQAKNRYRALLDAVIRAQAELIGQWMLVGFIHGVMNTDNMSVSGETIDYGPCAFMDEYDPATVYSAIDRHGRYAYANQPAIAHWNLTRLAECLLPLLAEETDHAVAEATDALAAFAPTFETAYQERLRRKLGFFTEQPGDDALGRDLLQAMHANRADFTLTFRRLSDAESSAENNSALRNLFADPSVCDRWLVRWRERLKQEPEEGSKGQEEGSKGEGRGSSAKEAESKVERRTSSMNNALMVRRNAMRAVNPAYIPRNHRVEAVIRAAVDHDDFRPFEELLTLLSSPFDDQPEFGQFAEPPLEHERVCQTFCGT